MKVIPRKYNITRSRILRGSKKGENRFTNRDQEYFPLYHNTQYSYCHKYIPKKHKLKDRRQFINLMRFITDQLVHGILEEKDGVHLEGIGYFFVFMVPEVRPNQRSWRFSHVMHRDNYACFMATGKNNPFADFQMAYDNDVKAEVRRRLANGQVHTHKLSLLLHGSQYSEIQEIEKKYQHKRKNK